MAAKRKSPGEVSQASPLGALAVHLLMLWRKSGEGGLLVLSDSERRAEHLAAMLHGLAPACDPMVLPRWDALPYDGVLPSQDVLGRRASVLRRLCERSRKPLVLATADSALQHVPPQKVWVGATLRLRPGAKIDEDEVRAFLERTGYELEPRVDAPGEAAILNQVIDIFPAGALGPVRIDHAKGRIVELQNFDPATQMTTGHVAETVVGPANEMFAAKGRRPQLVSLFDYMPDAVILEDGGVEARAEAWLAQVRESFEGRRALRTMGSGASPASPDVLYMTVAEWRAALKSHKIHVLPATHAAETRVPKFIAQKAPLAALRKFLEEQLARRRRIVFTAATTGDLKTLESRARRALGSRTVVAADTWQDVLDAKPRSLIRLRVDFDSGFVLPSQEVAVIAATDVLGSRAARAVPLGWREVALSEPVETLRPGDLVIHLERGAGRLEGLETLKGAGLEPRDVLRIAFDGAAVMVPVEDLGLIWRYGTEGLRLDKPDGSTWTKRRQALEKDIGATARRLVAAIREREQRDAPRLVPPTAQYEQFAARFPFFLTPDQADAVEDVLADLASGHPMDRLVCGDVGFGKTEVALRAAAAAVLSGTQVAMVAPTTVLARQHLETFRQRFAGMDVEIGQLSRFSSAAEARRVKAGLADGTVHIVIGTHAIAGKGVRFDDLGLLIIDEEQKFGAAEKTRLRKLGADAHVLTLTATPIPRTMQGAVAGLKSLSIIATPPARRLPVRTIVTSDNSETIRRALVYERRRGGQSFVVCPRIEDIRPWQTRLHEIVPDLRIETLHGKMPAAEIDDVMLRFAAGEGDVLLATNIIESGLDLPRANTILITRPDRLGLAQLHQLRGRVGRGTRRGYAFLLGEPDSKAKSGKRVAVLQELDDLGAGFRISQRDLDLRGAGDLFGETQAGHVKLVGLPLYRHLLERALCEARGEAPPEDYVPELNLEIAGRIPTDYIRDAEARLNLYARVARADETEVEQLAAEFEDRFGALPKEVEDLLAIAAIRHAAHMLGIARLDAGPDAIALTFREERLRRPPAPSMPEEPHAWRDGRLIIEVESALEQRLETVEALLEELAG